MYTDHIETKMTSLNKGINMNTMNTEIQVNLDAVVDQTVTVADIQAKKTIGDSCDTRVRKSWVLQMPEDQKAKFDKFPGYVKIQLYRSFDYEVQEIWVKLMRMAHKTALENGAKYVKVNGISRLEDAFCTNTDELLLEAARIWLEDFSNRSAMG